MGATMFYTKSINKPYKCGGAVPLEVRKQRFLRKSWAKFGKGRFSYGPYVSMMARTEIVCSIHPETSYTMRLEHHFRSPVGGCKRCALDRRFRRYKRRARK